GHNFVWDLDLRLHALRQSLNKEGAAQCLRLTHTMKGEARSLGFSDLQDQLHLLEQSLLKEDFDQSSHIMESISATAQALHESFDLIKHGDRQIHGSPIMGLVQTVLMDAYKRLREAGFELISDIHLNWVELN